MPEPSWGLAPPRFQAGPGVRPGCVRLQVADLERSLAWYGRVLGLGAVDRQAGWAALGVPGEPVLVELHERPGARRVLRGQRLGLFHYALLLPGRAMLGRLVRHLGELQEPLGASDHRVSEALYLTDPDGLGIEVYADRPRATWAREGAELVMTTEPLDLLELARAGEEDGPWQGIPPGTVMGHVHLHVGALDRASVFYHEGLGLHRTVWSYPGALFLSAGGYHHHLGLNTWARGAPPPGEGEARLLEWEWVVASAEELQAALASLEAAGHAGVDDHGPGVRVPDPWGTPVRLRTPAPG